MEIVILNRQKDQAIDPAHVDLFLRRLMELCPAGSANTFGVCFVDDAPMQQANREFRGIDRPTDVLSFPGDESPAVDGSHSLGDVMISIETAKRQAADAGHDLDRELNLLLIHGYLHLLGYDHEADDGEMLTLEASLRSRLLAGGNA